MANLSSSQPKSQPGSQIWDAIVVGAGPAGCAAAFDLASAGRSVLLLDRADFPRHKACAGGLTRKSLRALRYSVAPVTRETISSIVVEKRRGQSATLSSRNPVCAMTVRQELDAFCLRQTMAAGAHFAKIGQIQAIEQGSDGVALLSDEQSHRGRFLVAADGVHSRIRQLLYGHQPQWFRRGFAIEAELRLPNAGTSRLIFDLAGARRGYGWVFPKSDHLNVGLYTEAADEKLNRERLLAWVRARFGEAQMGAVTGQYLGFGAEADTASFPRAFLVGDAGGFADIPSPGKASMEPSPAARPPPPPFIQACAGRGRRRMSSRSSPHRCAATCASPLPARAGSTEIPTSAFAPSPRPCFAAPSSTRMPTGQRSPRWPMRSGASPASCRVAPNAKTYRREPCGGEV